MLIKDSRSKHGYNWDCFLDFWGCVCLFLTLPATRASASKGSHFVWVLFWVFLFLTQKCYSHLSLLPSVLASEVTALET